MYSTVSDPTELALSLLYRLRLLPIRTYPFDHFYGQGCFEPMVSECIQEYWPAADLFTAISETKRVSPGSYPQRHLISVSELTKNLSINTKEKAFWGNFASAVLGDSFLTGVLDWLWPHIKTARDLPKKISIHSECVLTEDHQGYRLTPHTDAPNRLVTILFYVPAITSESMGTSLYVRKEHVVKIPKPSASHWARENFNKVYTAPFVRDACLGFVVGAESFHGVEPIGTLATVRRQIQYAIRYREVS
jgi:hypothetical protein